MPTQLATLQQEWAAVLKRYQNVVPELQTIIMQYRNIQSGCWPRVVDMLDALHDRLVELGAPNAAAPAAANDAQVATILREIDGAKAQCRRLAAAFWEAVPRYNRTLDELEALEKDINKVVKEKSAAFKVSSSVAELKKLSVTVKSTRVTIVDAMRVDKLPKPTDPLIN